MKIQSKNLVMVRRRNGIYTFAYMYAIYHLTQRTHTNLFCFGWFVFTFSQTAIIDTDQDILRLCAICVQFSQNQWKLTFSVPLFTSAFFVPHSRQCTVNENDKHIPFSWSYRTIDRSKWWRVHRIVLGSSVRWSMWTRHMTQKEEITT